MIYRFYRPAYRVRGAPHVFLLALLLVCADAASAAAPLTLVDAQRRALARSRQLDASESAVTAARERALAAGRLPDPMLGIGVDNVPIDGPERFSLNDDFMTMRRIGLAQEFTRSDKRRLRAARAGAEAEKMEAQKTVETALVERETARAWFARYYAEATAAVIAEQGAQARLELKSAEAAYRGGRGALADVLAARSALARFADRASAADLRVRTAKTALARWIGADAERPLGERPAVERIALDPATLETDLAHHPEMAVLARQEDIAVAAAGLARANRKPDWTVELSYQQRRPAYSNMVSLGVSLPLQWQRRHRQDRELSAQLALADQARAEREETLRMHVAETRAMIDEWQTTLSRHARFERELVPLARARTQAAASAYRGGQAALATVLAARDDEIAVRIEALQLAGDAASLWAQLNFLFPSEAGAAQAAGTHAGGDR